MLICLKTCCWSDVVRQRIPDSTHRKRSAANGRQTAAELDGSCPWSEERVGQVRRQRQWLLLGMMERCRGELWMWAAILYCMRSGLEASGSRSEPRWYSQSVRGERSSVPPRSELTGWSRRITHAWMPISTRLPYCRQECTKATTRVWNVAAGTTRRIWPSWRSSKPSVERVSAWKDRRGYVDAKVTVARHWCDGNAANNH